MILGLEVMFASIAAILSVLSFKTLRAIRHLGVGKSFWIPAILSSVLFLIGSAITILYEIGFSLTNQTSEIVQVSRILALSILVCGIYSYSRRVRTSLTEEFSIPEQLVKERLQIVSPTESDLESEAPIHEKRVHEARVDKGAKKEAAPECKHQFGYLRTLPKNVPIPTECLGCDRIIECRHSLVKTLEKRPQQA